MADVLDEARLAQILPAAFQPYLRIILDTSARYGLDPWLIIGAMWIETWAGTLPAVDKYGNPLYDQPGPAGTGDFISRSSKPGYAAYMGANGLPKDGRGWGRGLMQIDYGEHNAWVISNAWWDPAVNIDKGAQLMAASQRIFTSYVKLNTYTDGNTVVASKTYAAKLGLPANASYPDPRPLAGDDLNRAILSAHNAGAYQVLLSIAAGLGPDAGTTGKRYSAWVYANAINPWKTQY